MNRKPRLPRNLQRYDDGMPEAVQGCPVEEAIKVIGGKWKLLVLRSLLLNGPQRYTELLQTVTAISQKELTRNLRELTGAGLLNALAADTPGSQYALTPLGESLMPIFQDLLVWGRQMQAARI